MVDFLREVQDVIIISVAVLPKGRLHHDSRVASGVSVLKCVRIYCIVFCMCYRKETRQRISHIIGRKIFLGIIQSCLVTYRSIYELARGAFCKIISRVICRTTSREVIDEPSFVVFVLKGVMFRD